MLGPPTDNGKIELELRLTSADELQVERLFLSVGSPVPLEHQAAGADPLLDELTVEDDAAIAEPLIFTLELLAAVDKDGKGWHGAPWQLDSVSRAAALGDVGIGIGRSAFDRRRQDRPASRQAVDEDSGSGWRIRAIPTESGR